MKKQRRAVRLIGSVVFGILFWMVSGAEAAPTGRREIEMTPGPRMIRAVEALANDTLAAKEALRLSPEQEEAIGQEVVSFKKDLWKKEAVLIGMFEEISIKRRHGLLSREEYRSANQTTGGIEADELGRMIEAVAALQAILTPEQKETFRGHRRPQLTLQMPEGFNTRLGLMAIARWGEVYGRYRGDLGLSGAQTVALRDALEEARREILRIGNDIEISRMEAYDLLKEPIIDTEKTKEAMERTARLEGVFFPKLSGYSRKLEGVLTTPQRAKFAEIQKRVHRGGETAVALFGGSEEFPSPLDRAEELGLSRSQVERLAALEVAARRQVRLDRAALQGAHLDLEEMIRRGTSDQEIELRIQGIAERITKIEGDRLRARLNSLKILDEKQKVALRLSPPE